jgi:hypothetical protein
VESHGLKPMPARRSALQEADATPPYALSGGTFRSMSSYDP